MTNRKVKSGTIHVKALLAGVEEFLRTLVQTALEEVLEAEMTAALAAEKGERTASRIGYRSGYYSRTLITRIGRLELPLPQDRAGRFSTELFERYQRSERALAAALAEMVRARCFDAQNERRLPKSCAATASRPHQSVGGVFTAFTHARTCVKAVNTPGDGAVDVLWRNLVGFAWRRGRRPRRR